MSQEPASEANMMCGKCPQRGHQGCEVPRTSSRKLAIVSSLVCLGLASCATYRVNAFAADKTLVCPGESTTIRWEVQGPARLRADRGANDWDEQDVPSTGERSFSEIAKTTFTITAKKQNPALGNHKNQIVDVATNSPKGNTVTCAAGVCTATFTPSSAGVRVSRLATPMVALGGRDEPIKICVTHQAMPRTCIDAGSAIAVDVPFDGPWTMEAMVPSTQPPPQKLTINFDFKCPAP